MVKEPEAALRVAERPRALDDEACGVELKPNGDRLEEERAEALEAARLVAYEEDADEAITAARIEEYEEDRTYQRDMFLGRDRGRAVLRSMLPRRGARRARRMRRAVRTAVVSAGDAPPGGDPPPALAAYGRSGSRFLTGGV